MTLTAMVEQRVAAIAYGVVSWLAHEYVGPMASAGASDAMLGIIDD